MYVIYFLFYFSPFFFSQCDSVHTTTERVKYHQSVEGLYSVVLNLKTLADAFDGLCVDKQISMEMN